MKTLLLATIALCLAAGCGDDSNPGGGGSGGENAGGDNAGGDGGGGGDGGTGGTGGASCEEFLPVKGGPPDQVITITISNESAQPVYLGVTQETCSFPVPYRAATLGGDPVKTNLGGCELTCADLASGGCECAADCAQPNVTVIYPGGSYETVWVKRVYEATVMPDACYADEGCVMDSCIQQQDPAEALEFFVDGYPEIADCSEAICDCDGGVAGSCQVTGATLVGGTPVAASAEWEITDDAIAISFQ